MKPTALVITTVHWPDDTRIRERLIRSLAVDFDVQYAARSPGPSDISGLTFRELRGGRLRRNLDALRLALWSRWDVLVVHDPELVPVAFLARVVRRRPVVFDVHEDFPAVVDTRSWVPRCLRRPLAGLLRVVMRLAERFLIVTLAEPGYRRLFTGDHAVFPNSPDTSDYPHVEESREEEAVYLGDATLERGVDVAIEACRLAGVNLRLVGRISEGVRKLVARDGAVVVEGVVPNPEAIRLVSRAAVGLVPLRDLRNYRHSQPTKLLEYLAVGVPVVATDLPGTRELVEGLKAVRLVPPGDAGSMADAIQESLSEDSLRIAIEQADEVRERFRWPQHEVTSFYKTLVSR